MVFKWGLPAHDTQGGHSRTIVHRSLGIVSQEPPPTLITLRSTVKLVRVCIEF